MALAGKEVQELFGDALGMAVLGQEDGVLSVGRVLLEPGEEARLTVAHQEAQVGTQEHVFVSEGVARGDDEVVLADEVFLQVEQGLTFTAPFRQDVYV